MAAPAYQPIRTKDYLALIKDVPSDGPVTVIHKLRFNPTAIYDPSSPHASLPPISGRDAFYQRYIPNGVAAAKTAGIKAGESKYFSTRVTNLIEGGEEWDVVAVRTYETFSEYARYQAGKEYQENAVPHRNAALANWALVACVEDDYPPKN